MTEPTPAPELEPLDLSAILEAAPPKRRAIIDVATLRLDRFGIGELLELTDAVGVDPDKLGAELRSSKGGRVVVALAWLIARRVEPGLTLADVERWDIEVRGRDAPPGPTPAARPSRARGKRSS